MKQDEIIRMARELATRHGSRMCDENGDTHGEELYCVGVDDVVEIIKQAAAHEREKQAEQEIIPSWEEYCECEGIPCEPVKPVDLTDDEIYEVLKRYTKTERYKDDFGSYRAVIAADREKNK